MPTIRAWLAVLTALSAAQLAAQPAARVYEEPPAGLVPNAHLTAQQRSDNFEALWDLIDQNYAQFVIKAIDWPEIGRRYRAQLPTIATDDDYYLFLFHLVNELKDTHSGLQNYRLPLLDDVPSLAIDLFQNKPYVIFVRPGSEAAAQGMKAGWEVVAVDGLTPDRKMESLRPLLPACSSERAWRRTAGRRLLAGPKGSQATIELRTPEGKTETVKLPRATGQGRRPPVPPAFACTRQKFIHYAVLPSGLGYIQIATFNGRQDLADEFDRALEAVRNTPALILDIRDNTGGFGQVHMVGRLLATRVATAISFRRSGPRHDQLLINAESIGPTGDWRYKAPIALLVNDVTGSAADLFACQLRSAKRVVTIGTATHGNLSGFSVFGVLPCNLVVRVSNAYVTDAKKHPIEVTGNVPDILVEPTIDDYLAGRDPVLQKAIDRLHKR